MCSSDLFPSHDTVCPQDGYVIPFGYTVQYVPAGQTAQTPAWNVTGDLLSANQYVMATGVWNPF